MAVRPLVTTGVALVSAGALVAGAPALFVPHSEVTVASPTASTVEAHKTLTQEQINLLAFTVTGAIDAFFNGYGGYYAIGGVPQPTTAVVVPAGDPDAGNLVDQYGTKLYVLDENGTAVRATAADLEPGKQYYNSSGAPVYVVDENGDPVLTPDPGNCSATGAICQDGFTGLAYYASDQLLPLGPIDNIFFEEGFTEFARIAAVTVAQAVDAVVPRLTLERRVNDFFAGGITLLTQNLIDDNLPDGPVGSWVKGLNDAFFEDGITGAVTYVVNAIISPTATESGIQALQVAEQDEVDAKSGVTSTGVPNFSKLLSLPTTKLDVESPWKKPPAPKLLQKEDEVQVSENVDGGTETTLVAEETKPEPLKITTPKFELPKLDPPKLNLDLKFKAKEVAANEEAGGTDTKTGNKVAPAITSDNGKSSGDHNGKKFLTKLKDAVDKATGGEKDSGDSDK
ncbi:hypothetical protein BN970_03398 [Mycolicibacterium conceptionense]|uniref:PE-PPE domain-containing protein n=1 Tax=Mycolicibacterium conceptionense TaxID=451644 RepID=A0A0U1DH17_9MYCO|nr:hypothetical protein [Mycolicibacterium conceptionense]ORV24548.1 hypothetical protein AWB98_19995 [Mycolicibacterium conceptionense]CQD16062.1 hypothetical protein BN970_03398 [Mycolicibacterium conceptionense]